MDPRIERTRRQVLEAVKSLMMEGGPAAVTYSALADRSGVGRATLYRHWPELDDLWQEVITEMASRFEVRLVGDVAADLLAAVESLRAALNSQERRAAMLAMMERAQWDQSARSFIDRMEKVSPVRQALGLAVENSQLPGGVDIELATSLLLGPLLHRALMTTADLDTSFSNAVVTAFLGTLQQVGRA